MLLLIIFPSTIVLIRSSEVYQHMKMIRVNAKISPQQYSFVSTQFGLARRYCVTLVVDESSFPCHLVLPDRCACVTVRFEQDKN